MQKRKSPVPPPAGVNKKSKNQSTTAPSPRDEAGAGPQAPSDLADGPLGEAGAGRSEAPSGLYGYEGQVIADDADSDAEKRQILAERARENLKKDSEEALVLALEDYIHSMWHGENVEVRRKVVCEMRREEPPAWILAIKLPQALLQTSLRQDWKPKILYSLFLAKLDLLRLRRDKNDVRRWNCSAIPNYALSGKRCRSWRCFSCGDLRARMDAWKIEQGMKKMPRWFWLVTTLGKRLQRQDVELNYQEFSTRWNRMMIEFRKEFGSDIVYIQTIEAHTGNNGQGSQQPHANTLLAGDFFTTANEKEIKKCARWLKDNGPRWGFGFILTLREVDERRAAHVSRYIAGFGVQTYAKASMSAIVGEVAKLKQIPTFAPKGTRRLRSSGKLMPQDKDYYAQFPPESLVNKQAREARTRAERTDTMLTLEKMRQNRLNLRVQTLHQVAEA